MKNHQADHHAGWHQAIHVIPFGSPQAADCRLTTPARLAALKTFARGSFGSGKGAKPSRASCHLRVLLQTFYNVAINIHWRGVLSCELLLWRQQTTDSQRCDIGMSAVSRQTQTCQAI